MATPLGAVLPWWGGDFRDLSGEPLAAGRVFFYSAGTSTKIDTYSDSDLSTPNTNPVVLDSAGRATIFLGPNTYKVVVATSTASDPPVGAQIIRTIDGVAASTSLTNTNIPFTAGESIAAGQWVFLSNGSNSLTAGRWYLTDADEEYKSILPEQIGISNDTLAAGETGTLLLSGRFELLSGTVTAGATYYLSGTSGAITSTRPTNWRTVATADSTTSVILSYWQPTAFTVGVMPGGVNVTTVGNTGGGEDDLMSYTVDNDLVPIPSGGFYNAFEFEAFGTTANNTNTKQIKVYFDGTAIIDTGALAFQNQPWRVNVTIIQRTALSNGCAYVASFVPSPGAAGAVIVTATGSTTLTTGFIFKITGTSVSVPTTNDIVQFGMISKKVATVL